MLGWVRMPESGVVQVASTTGHDLVLPRYFAHQRTHFKSIIYILSVILLLPIVNKHRAPYMSGIAVEMILVNYFGFLN